MTMLIKYIFTVYLFIYFIFIYPRIQKKKKREKKMEIGIQYRNEKIKPY